VRELAAELDREVEEWSFLVPATSADARIETGYRWPGRCGTEVAEPVETPVRLKLVLLALVLSFSPAATRGDAKDGDTLDGTWLPETAELGGKMFPDEIRKSIKLVVKDGKYTVTVGKVVDQGTAKLNPKAKPKEMDVTGTDGPNKGKTFLAIYERDGDTLRVCYDLGGKNRPTEFKTKEGTQLFLVTYKLEKP
jgi:uncharacterized protein (TIGR03067 family)